MPPQPANDLEGDGHLLDSAESRRALSAFLFFGVLTSALGAFLPAWGYHLESHFITVGNFFLSFNVGLLAAVWFASKLLPGRGLVFVLVLASGVACGAFLMLAALPDTAWELWRGLALLLLGFGAGLLNAAVFRAISPLFEHDRAATTTLAGTLYGLGCFITALLVAGTYYVYSVPTILALFAVIAGIYVFLFSRAQISTRLVEQERPVMHVLDDFTNPGAILFALILFFQFGNEWSIAGWLPLFLIRRLGISPEASLFMLAFYWGALLVGRVVANSILNKVSHGKLLFGSIVLALMGCILLTYTTNLFGANTGILFVGSGFASIYPLVVEKIGCRFRYFHPGLYNGIFSFAFTGGLLAPAILGYIAQFWGVGSLMVLPMLGSFMVFVLVLLVMLETKLNGEAGVTGAKA